MRSDSQRLVQTKLLVADAHMLGNGPRIRRDGMTEALHVVACRLHDEVETHGSDRSILEVARLKG